MDRRIPYIVYVIPFEDEQMKASHLIEQEEEVASLTEQLETRKIIERAKGHLIERGLTEQEAFRKIRKVSMDNHKSMREVGEAILLAKDM